jgi:hypothetical protein
MKRILVFTVLVILFSNSWAQTRLRLSFTGSPSVNWMKSNNDTISGSTAIFSLLKTNGTLCQLGYRY